MRRKNLERALDKGVDVVGGIPHFERTMEDGARSIEVLCDIAAERGLMVDMHCDETDDPLSRHIETLAAETQRLGLHGRVTGSHLTSMHSMDNYYVSKLLPLMAEAQVHAVANPLINIVLQGRHDTYPKRRGQTRVPEMRAHGINVAFGHDCVMDPWYSLGSADMLDVAHMALHVGQMTSREAMRYCFEAVTTNAAKIMGLEGYGLDVGCNGDLVVLQAADPIEAIRLKARRLVRRAARQGDRRKRARRDAARSAGAAARGRCGGLYAAVIPAERVARERSIETRAHVTDPELAALAGSQVGLRLLMRRQRGEPLVAPAGELGKLLRRRLLAPLLQDVRDVGIVVHLDAGRL